MYRNTRNEDKIPRKHIVLILFIFILWGLGGWIAPAEAGTPKDAATFTEEKILPNAKIAGEVLADKSKKVWQALVSE